MSYHDGAGTAPEARVRAWRDQLADDPSVIAQMSDIALRRVADLNRKEMRALTTKAERERRDMSRSETVRFDQLERDTLDLDAKLSLIASATPEPRRIPPAGIEQRATPYALLNREARMADRYHDDSGYEQHEPFQLGRLVRGMVTGHWDGGDAEKRALSEASMGAGGNLLPTPISSYVIDRVRNQARVIEAGAQTIAMDNDTLAIPRLTTGVTAGWRLENTAVAQSDPAFDRVTLTARTLAVLTLLSYELFQDLTSAGAEIVERELIQALAVELDRAALRGSGTAPEPRGLKNITGVAQIANGVNGTAYSYDQAVAVVAVVEANGFMPNAIIGNPRVLKSAAGLKDSTGRYIDAPGYLDNIPVLPTNQIPTNLTVGTSTDTSELYTGQWDQMLVGFRPQVGITVQRSGGPAGMVGVKVNDSAYMSQMSVAILAFLRADVAVTHPEAFAISTGIRP